MLFVSTATWVKIKLILILILPEYLLQTYQPVNGGGCLVRRLTVYSNFAYRFRIPLWSILVLVLQLVLIVLRISHLIVGLIVIIYFS